MPPPAANADQNAARSAVRVTMNECPNVTTAWKTAANAACVDNAAIIAGTKATVSATWPVIFSPGSPAADRATATTSGSSAWCSSTRSSCGSPPAAMTASAPSDVSAAFASVFTRGNSDGRCERMHAQGCYQRRRGDRIQQRGPTCCAVTGQGCEKLTDSICRCERLPSVRDAVSAEQAHGERHATSFHHRARLLHAASNGSPPAPHQHKCHDPARPQAALPLHLQR